MTVIQTEDLTKVFNRRGKQSVVAVTQLSLSVDSGQVFGFIGPNGSGKTTTIGMLLGTVTPTRGTWSLFGHTGPRARQALAGRIGATLEQPNFFPHLNCRQNLRLVARLRGVGKAEVEAALKTVGLGKRASTSFKACSLGMKQRLALGATLLGDPDLIVLDEPANGLDPHGQWEIREIIRSLAARGKTIFLASHILHEVEQVCTHVAIVEQGRLRWQGAVGDLIKGSSGVRLQAPGDPEVLRRLVSDYEATRSARVSGDGVVVELDGDPADLNRFLTANDVHVSRLEVLEYTLEDAFKETLGDRPEEVQ